MSHEIRVWDPLVRVFHWSLVIAFTVAYISGEEEGLVHIYSGYAIVGLIVFRLIWGLVGSQYALFSNFVYRPSNIFKYFKTFISGSPKRYLGHNPLGGAMIIALLVSLFMVSISGMKLYAVEEGKGPFAGNDISLISSAYADSDEHEGEEEGDEEEFWEEIHEFFANFTVLLIILHILGVFMSGRLHKENLVKSMITGKKREN